MNFDTSGLILCCIPRVFTGSPLFTILSNSERSRWYFLANSYTVGFGFNCLWSPKAEVHFANPCYFMSRVLHTSLKTLHRQDIAASLLSKAIDNFYKILKLPKLLQCIHNW